MIRVVMGVGKTVDEAWAKVCAQLEGHEQFVSFSLRPQLGSIRKYVARATVAKETK